MKRFLVSFIIGVTMIAIGITTLVFEIRDYTFVDAPLSFMDNAYYTKNTNVTSNTRLYFDNNMPYEWDYDETMKDGEVKFEVADFIDYTTKRDSIYIEYKDGYEYEYEYRHGWNNNGWDALGKIIDGLKDHKIYSLRNLETVRITSNRYTKDNLRIEHE